MKSWKTLASKIIEDNTFFTLKADDFETVDGVKGTWYYHDNVGGAACVIGQMDDDCFLLIEEYRYLRDMLSVSHIAGRVEKGEEPVHTARREFLEESGYEAEEFIYLGTLVNAPAFSKEELHYFLARGLKKAEQSLDEVEQIKPLMMSMLEVERAIQDGHMWNANAVAGVHLLQKYLAKEKEL
jgi:ADP-ribose pyrophosphatase